MNQNSVLTLLQLDGIGPAKQLSFEPGDRLNVITGDNGLGKSFLLECMWFALSGPWAGFPAYPSEFDGKNEAKLMFHIMDRANHTGTKQEIHYDRDHGIIFVISSINMEGDIHYLCVTSAVSMKIDLTILSIKYPPRLWAVATSCFWFS